MYYTNTAMHVHMFMDKATTTGVSQLITAPAARGHYQGLDCSRLAVYKISCSSDLGYVTGGFMVKLCLGGRNDYGY